MGEDESSVRVAVRIRPQIARELIDMCRVCTTVTPGEPQVTLNPNKSFTFDYVFDTIAQQDEIYDGCIANLIEGAFNGYNATVLAYGQTGSGKTYTMGTGFEVNAREEQVGIIPRAINHLFRGIEQLEMTAKLEGKSIPQFKITAQFLELYNEEIIDLFESADGFKPKGHVKILEDPAGGINVVGVATKPVNCANDALHLLRTGALSRTTGSTEMNSESSRSHAIFTLIIKQQRLIIKSELADDEKSQSAPQTDFETLSAKFHFVDLAGSERLKRTKSVGSRAKEGISINCGLLCLGNVISALGDKTLRASYVPYRNSKLTRLLQDSLGGNSQTVMLACVSPSDSDFMETLNTLKYANRARNIKNRVTVNQDSSSKLIVTLRSQVLQLELELAEYKQGKRMVGEDGVETVNDMFHENTMLQSEMHLLRTRVKAMQETMDMLKERNTQLLAEQVCSRLGTGDGPSEVADIIKEYLREIEELRSKVLESEKTCEILRKRESRPSLMMSMRPANLDMSLGDTAVSSLIAEAKRDIEKDMSLLKAKEVAGTDKKQNSDPLDDRSGSESEGEGDDGEGDDYNSDTDTEEKESDADGLDLAHLTTEISTKQKLIDQLEMSQQRIHVIKQQYEDKLALLQNRIRVTQDERDKMMATFVGSAGAGNQASEKSNKKAQQDYDRRLQLMQKEVRSLQAALKKHEQVARQNSQSEKQLKMLRSEMVEMKRAKVNLMKKMKEDAAKHKQVDDKRNREIAQLRKETRKRENQIRTLEADRKMKDVVLRRKNEEVSALRKNMRNGMSNKAAGRLRPNPDSNMGVFSPKASKKKWQTIEKTINKIARNKHAIATMEQEMERKLREREVLGHSLDDLKRRRRQATREYDINDLDEQIEGTQANIDYIQEGITEAQQAIVTIEETKEDGQDGLEVTSLVQTVAEVEEARYLMEKLYNMTVNQSYSAAQKDMVILEMEAKLAEEKQQNAIQKQLLDHLVDRHQYDIFSSSLAEEMLLSGVSIPESVGSSSLSSRSTSPTQADSCNGNGNGNGNGNSRLFSLNNPKIRRRTALPEELLYPNQPPLALDSDDTTNTTDFLKPPGVNPDTLSVGLPSSYSETLRSPVNSAEVFKVPTNSADVLRPTNYSEILGKTSTNYLDAMRPPSTPESLKLMTSSLKLDSLKSSPVLARKAYDRQDSTSPRPVRRNTYILSHSNLPGKLGSMEQGLDASPPGSPTAYRRNLRDENVFSRLTGGQNCSPSEQLMGTGVITPFQGKLSTRASLICTHVAKGHSRAVLSVDATDDLLFSASKDRTVKVWDICAGVEVISLQGHPNNVTSVKYHEESRLVFSMSSYMVKVWDMRDPTKCIKTLCSSGLPSAVSVQAVTATRTLQYPPGESLLNAMTLNNSGSLLYAVTNDKIRVWDLRNFELTGKLTGGHQAAVMCMAVGKVSEEEDMLITGSKDHYIKVFEVNRGNGAAVFTPKMNLEPPHYDGVQSLAIHGNILFSGSRDTCIKKWDLTEQEPFQQSQNNAHKDWVTCLQFMPGGQRLLSGCRQGIMKIWAANTFSLLGEVKAHSEPINAITTNKSSIIFTASNDGNVSIWRARSRYFLPDTSSNNV